jgi:hypothetical protein
LHKSPLAWHEYALLQAPPWHNEEQQSAALVQAWPSTLQVPPVNSAHAPAVQTCVQHSVAAEQLVPISLQVAVPHLPP